MIVEVGHHLAGEVLWLDTRKLTESVPGAIYEVVVRTRGIRNPEEVAEKLLQELPRRFDLDIIWLRVDDNEIRMQIEGSPFPWAALLAFLPEILGLIGIVVVLISVGLLIAYAPSWLLAMLIIGALLAYLGPSIGRWMLGLIKPIREGARR